MKKYTANYTYTNPNFVIQNLIEQPVKSDLLPYLYVLKNILQRGFPTLMSKYLQNKIGKIQDHPDFEKRFLLINDKTPIWLDTIKGDQENHYYPAKDFFKNLIPKEFGKYGFIQSLIIPEIEINEITGEYNPKFVNQQVDFYLPQAKLVIEIDGQQHTQDIRVKKADQERDKYLLSKKITTFRITTSELKNGTYKTKTQDIYNHLQRYEKILDFYNGTLNKIRTKTISQDEIKYKLLPTAVLRFQILLIELLVYKYLSLKDEWNFNIHCPEPISNFAELAVEDTFIWLKQLWKLKNKTELSPPSVKITVTTSIKDFKPTPKSINIDFSLFKKYTDENKVNPDVIFVRTDYFDILKDRNYFQISTTDSIQYNITEPDKETLTFFLHNIFDKPSFRDGQFPIIANALNLKDTIGLLPTGGGKSLCYQLPCLLQPSINFVVCPIKSLMYDQHENLKNAWITNTTFITSDQESWEKEKIENDFEKGKYLFAWISPERLQKISFRNKIKSITSNYSITYAVIDEIHCLSEWGHDFRTSYLNLAKTIDNLSPKDENGEGKIKFIGLTATASVNVLKDIKIEFSRQKQQLEEENIKSLLDYSREELQFEVINDKGGKQIWIKKLMDELVTTTDLTKTDKKSALIFTPHVNGAFGCYGLSNYLNILYPQKVNWYSGEVPKDTIPDRNGGKIRIPIMSDDEFIKQKEETQRNFKNNKTPILVATKAFGMGIDKQNIHYTIHYGIPSSVESLYQEAGRAGRWGKNSPDKATCYVLYSPEIFNKEKVEELFHIDTTFSKMKKINEETRGIGRDLFRQVFLFMQGHNDIQDDFRIIIELVNRYFIPNATIQIFWSEVFGQLKIKENTLQKAIYRLSLLGIIKDWTTDFKTHYEVEFSSIEEKDILKNITNYIHKYVPGKQVENEIRSTGKKTFLENAVWYLLSWIFENIAYNRKQSLKTLRDWCDDYQDSDSFKKRIDSYFKFSETTFILQHIAENPKRYDQWFEALVLKKQDSTNTIINTTYLPDIQNAAERKEKFESLRDSISRFLESYNENTGLNLLSGLCRLYLDQYEDSDGIERFQKSLKYIQANFTIEDQEDILGKLVYAGKNLGENLKVSLCNSITRFYPEKLEYLADYYELPYLLNDTYEQKINKLKNNNKKLYEQLTEI